MKPFITLLIALFSLTSSFSQEEASNLNFNSFETDFFTYKPEQKKNVTDDHFSFAEFVISETKRALNNDVNNYSVIHYWNIITALDKLKEDKSIILLVFQKMVLLEGSCNYIVTYKDKISFYNTIPAMYDHYYSQCKKDNSSLAGN